jgi:glycosyltransferase involved in cell wall biosynthesis
MAAPSLRPLRIAQVAPPFEAIPPDAYGGTERIIAALVAELLGRGHDVTTFASGDSRVAGRLVPTVPRALWAEGAFDEGTGQLLATAEAVIRQARDFDLVHSHLEWFSPLLARGAPVPVVATFHGRLDRPWGAALLADSPAALVAISASQAAQRPEASWAAVVHNGLDLHDAPFRERPGTELCFVGRIAPEKGVLDAIDVARRSGLRLRIAAKLPRSPAERDYFEHVFQPACQRADVIYLGELGPADRDDLFAESLATLMPGRWPEPFGLVAIESLACGTPVLARPAGALPEIVRHGLDGFLDKGPAGLAEHVPEVAALDRKAIRRDVLERFSAARMADGYEAVYARLLERRGSHEHGRGPHRSADGPAPTDRRPG